jgi:hypothetical protein
MDDYDDDDEYADEEERNVVQAFNWSESPTCQHPTKAIILDRGLMPVDVDEHDWYTPQDPIVISFEWACCLACGERRWVDYSQVALDRRRFTFESPRSTS